MIVLTTFRNRSDDSALTQSAGYGLPGANQVPRCDRVRPVFAFPPPETAKMTGLAPSGEESPLNASTSAP
jgi:hypothetical protein